MAVGGAALIITFALIMYLGSGPDEGDDDGSF